MLQLRIMAKVNQEAKSVARCLQIVMKLSTVFINELRSRLDL
jgi:hypothetical protein